MLFCEDKLNKCENSRINEDHWLKELSRIIICKPPVQQLMKFNNFPVNSLVAHLSIPFCSSESYDSGTNAMSSIKDLPLENLKQVLQFISLLTLLHLDPLRIEGTVTWNSLDLDPKLFLQPMPSYPSSEKIIFMYIRDMLKLYNSYISTFSTFISFVLNLLIY